MRDPDEQHGNKEGEFLSIVSSGIASEVDDFLENNENFDTSCKDDLGRSALFIAADANNVCFERFSGFKLFRRRWCKFW
jgi:hypothetical protein